MFFTALLTYTSHVYYRELLVYSILLIYTSPNPSLSTYTHTHPPPVDISVGVSKQDPLYSQKMGLIEKQGRGATSVRFPLQDNRYGVLGDRYLYVYVCYLCSIVILYTGSI